MLSEWRRGGKKSVIIRKDLLGDRETFVGEEKGKIVGYESTICHPEKRMKRKALFSPSPFATTNRSINDGLPNSKPKCRNVSISDAENNTNLSRPDLIKIIWFDPAPNQLTGKHLARSFANCFSIADEMFNRIFYRVIVSFTIVLCTLFSIITTMRGRGFNPIQSILDILYTII